MKAQVFKVILYHGGEYEMQTKYTPYIDEARFWLSQAEHGQIINNQGIAIQ